LTLRMTFSSQGWFLIPPAIFSPNRTKVKYHRTMPLSCRRRYPRLEGNVGGATNAVKRRL